MMRIVSKVLSILYFLVCVSFANEDIEGEYVYTPHEGQESGMLVIRKYTPDGESHKFHGTLIEQAQLLEKPIVSIFILEVKGKTIKHKKNQVWGEIIKKGGAIRIKGKVYEKDRPFNEGGSEIEKLLTQLTKNTELKLNQKTKISYKANELYSMYTIMGNISYELNKGRQKKDRIFFALDHPSVDKSIHGGLFKNDITYKEKLSILCNRTGCEWKVIGNRIEITRVLKTVHEHREQMRQKRISESQFKLYLESLKGGSLAHAHGQYLDRDYTARGYLRAMAKNKILNEKLFADMLAYNSKNKNYLNLFDSYVTVSDITKFHPIIIKDAQNLLGLSKEEKYIKLNNLLHFVGGNVSLKEQHLQGLSEFIKSIPANSIPEIGGFKLLDELKETIAHLLKNKKQSEKIAKESDPFDNPFDKIEECEPKKLKSEGFKYLLLNNYLSIEEIENWVRTK